MNTINGPVELLFCRNSSTRILNFYTGKEQNCVIASKNVDYVRFFVCPNVYSLNVGWQILQNEKFVKVSEILTGEFGEILDKFGRMKNYVKIGGGHDQIGWPDVNIWYDRDFVIKNE